jgi:uncharacterized membrane protein YdbT with pleckstrin-like domain
MRGGVGRYSLAVPYPEENLHPNEELVLDLHPHWWTITPSVLALAVVVVFGVMALLNEWSELVQMVAAILIIANLIWFGLRYLQLMTTHFVLTSDRVIYRSGIIAKRGVEIPLESINAIRFSQKVWERALGLGDLKVDSASAEGVSEFENVRRPNMVQNEIYIQMEENSNRKFDRVSAGINALPGSAPAESITDQIDKLGELCARGVISEDEFQAKKNELLGRM